MSLIIGVPACSKFINGEPQHATPTRYGRALMGAASAIPVLLPPVGEAMLAVLDRLDGLLLSGSPSNVEPSLYGVASSLTPASTTSSATARRCRSRSKRCAVACRCWQFAAGSRN